MLQSSTSTSAPSANPSTAGAVARAAGPVSDGGPVLHLEGLWVGGLPLTLEAGRGRIVHLRGGSRAQRLRVLCIAAGMAHAGPGHCRLLGQPLHTLAPEARRQLCQQEVGHVLSFDDLASDISTLGALAVPLLCRGVPPSAAFDRARQLLRVFGLSDRSTDTTDGLTPRQRRLAVIARALAGRPALLVIEDLDLHLLPIDVAAVRAALRVVVATEDTTVLMSTSQTRLAAMADQVLDLDHPGFS